MQTDMSDFKIHLILLSVFDTVVFASEKHKNQRRKDSEKTPYINHPLNVCFRLIKAAITDVDVLNAALLHDIIEDTDTTFEELVDRFGKRVATIVAECSDNKELDKVERKRLQVEHAKHVSHEAKLVKLADKLDNVAGLVANPPASWSLEEIKGYVLWSYCVCTQMSSASKNLTMELEKIFEIFSIPTMTESKREIELKEYYHCIDKSE